jgi:hypothetical protein
MFWLKFLDQVYKLVTVGNYRRSVAHEVGYIIALSTFAIMLDVVRSLHS